MRITSCSSGGMPSNTGATITTRWPALRHSPANATTDRATPPTNGVNVLVIIQIFMYIRKMRGYSPRISLLRSAAPFV